MCPSNFKQFEQVLFVLTEEAKEVNNNRCSSSWCNWFSTQKFGPNEVSFPDWLKHSFNYCTIDCKSLNETQLTME